MDTETLFETQDDETVFKGDVETDHGPVLEELEEFS